ncbi:MAG: hypothetical protein K8I30_06485 [Anaerolineae bacterium]|nr:hypothetical protein [Anaerolineae bacterium]
MMTQPYSPQDRLQKRLNRMRRVFIHLVLTLIIVLSITWAVEQTHVPRSLENIVPAAVLLFIAHALWVVYQESSAFIVHQEMQRAGYDEDAREKPKRGAFTIDDEGELVEIMDEAAQDEKPKHNVN